MEKAGFGKFYKEEIFLKMYDKIEENLLAE